MENLQHQKMIQYSSLAPCLGVTDHHHETSFVTTVVCGVDAMELNNVAVAMIRARKYEEALSLLDDAWTAQTVMERAHQSLASSCALYSLSAPSIELAIMSLASKVYDDRQPSIYSTPADDRDTATVNVAGESDLHASPSNYFSMYNGAFAFSCDRARALTTVQKLRLVPAIILYNMGLVLHKQALQSVKCDNFGRAFGLYRMSLGIVEDCIRCSLFSSEYSLLQLAIYNNLGFINSHFFEEEEAMVCAGRMLATFASMDCSRLLSKEEYVFYYMNLLFLLHRNPIFAPAA